MNDMASRNHSNSGKTRFLRIGCILLFLCLVLSGCQKPAEEKPAEQAAASAQETSLPGPAAATPPSREPTAWDTAFETGSGFLEETSLLPEDLTGFSIGLMSGEESQLGITGDPVRTDGNGVRYYAVTEELAEQINHLHPRAQSVGPDGAILWYAESPGMFRNMFVQRDRDFLSVHMSQDRGVQDEAETGWTQKMSSVWCDTFEWSPDGQYVFYNNWERWHNFNYDRMMLPFLLDTRTGEVFQIYSLPGLNQIPPVTKTISLSTKDKDLAEMRAKTAVSCGTWDGHFSRDGRWLYLLMYGINLPGWESEKALMRYDLEIGQMEHCCWLSEGACSFREMGDGRLLVCCTDSDWQVVSAGDAGFTVSALEGSVLPNVRYFRFRNGLSDSDAILDCSTALAVIRDRAESVDEWFVLQDPDEGFRKVAAQDLPNIYNRYYIDTSIPVRNTPFVILRISGFRTVAESWTPITEHEIRLMLLNTETMALKPLRADYETLVSTHNETASGDLLLGESTAFRLNPDKPAPAEETSEKTAFWLECYNSPVDQIAYRYEIKADYSYEFVGRKKSDPLTLAFRNNSYSRTEGFQFDSDIQVLPDSYLLAVHLQMNYLKENVPEYLIPPVLTEERYAEVFEKNGIEATREKTVDSETSLPKGKKIRGTVTVTVPMYEKVTPEDLPSREDAEELAARYPSIAEQPLYILPSSVREDDKKALQEKLEGLYTMEDYWQDFQLVNASRWSKGKSQLKYVIHSDNPDIRWIQGPAVALCTLSDRLGSAVYNRYASADPKPESVESLALGGSCLVADIPYQVSLVSVQEEGDELTVVFSVVPEDEYGMFPVDNQTEETDPEGGEPS